MDTQLNSILETLVNILEKQKTSSSSIDDLNNRLQNFYYKPSSGYTFTNWFQRHEITFKEAARTLTMPQQVELLLNNLQEYEYRQLCGRVSPRKPTEMEFEELVKTLSDLFADTRTLFQRRYETLTAEETSKNIGFMLGTVNLDADLFEFETLNLDQFKLLLAALRMSNASNEYYAPYRAIILREGASSTFAEIREKCRLYFNQEMEIAAEKAKSAVKSKPWKRRNKNNN